MSEWHAEVLYVRRNARGVITGISQHNPSRKPAEESEAANEPSSASRMIRSDEVEIAIQQYALQKQMKQEITQRNAVSQALQTLANSQKSQHTMMRLN